MPNRPVADVGRGGGKHRVARADRLRLQLAEPRHGSKGEGAIVSADVSELAHAVEIHEHGRPRQPELHHRQQALPAREDASLRAMADEQSERLVERGRTVVLERRGLHRAPPSRAVWIDLKTRSGESGSESTETPRGASASDTALARAGSGAMAPPSPMPLIPPTVKGDGVSMWCTSMAGTSVALGSRYSMSVCESICPFSSYTRCSSIAPPMPCAVPPCTWPSTMSGLIMVPQSSTTT